MHMHTRIYVHVCGRVSERINVFFHLVHACMSVCVCVYMHESVCLCMCEYACMCVRMYDACVCVCVHVCMYVCVCVLGGRWGPSCLHTSVCAFTRACAYVCAVVPQSRARSCREDDGVSWT